MARASSESEALGGQSPFIRKVKSAYANQKLTAVFLTTFFVVAFCVTIGFELQRRHDQTLAQAERNLSALVSVTASDVEAQLDKIQLLEAAFAPGLPDARAGAASTTVRGALERMAGALPWLAGIALENEAGSDVIIANAHFSDQLYGMASGVLARKEIETPSNGFGFRYVSNATGVDLIIASTFLRDSVSPASAKLTAIHYLIEPTRFAQQSLAKANPAGDLDVMLLDSSGVIVASDSSRSISSGTKPSFIGARLSLPPTSEAFLFYDRDAPDRDMLNAARVVPGYSFLIVISQSTTAILTPWRSAIPFYLAILLAPCAIGIAFAYMLTKQAGQAERTNRRLHESRRRFELAVKASNCGVWDWKSESDRFVWSRGMFDLLGMDGADSEIEATEVGDLIHPDDEAKFRNLFWGGGLDDTDFDDVVRLKHANGTWRAIRLKGQRLDKPATSDTRFLGIALDITEIAIARQTAEDAEARLRRMIESLDETFVLYDTSGDVVLSNARFQSVEPLIPKAALSEIEYSAPPSEIQLSDGRWIQFNKQKIDASNEVIVGADITPLKSQKLMLQESQSVLAESMKHMQRSKQQLQEQALRLSELAQQYAKEKARAETASRSKSEFLANMSHELRTPLNAIIGFSDIMIKNMFGPLGDGRYMEYATDINESGEQLLALINEILEMSRIDSGRNPLESEEIDLRGAVKDVLRIMEPRAFEANVRLRSEVAPSPSIQGDRRAVKQILSNLISNAIKFTPPDGSVTINSRYGDDMVAIRIIDTGIGIEQQDLERVGAPFEQIENQQNKTTPGKGLGLAMAKALVERHGGALMIASDIGIGTTVTVTFPAGAEAAAPTASFVPESPPEDVLIEDASVS
jgi:two-component system cell cycle sensor histidine kinase PleC